MDLERNVPTVQSTQQTVEVPRVQLIEKLVDDPTVMQRQASAIQSAQHDMQHMDEAVDVPALMQRPGH